MSKVRELIGIGLVSGLIAAGGIVGELATVTLQADKTMECGKLPEPADKDCIAATDYSGGELLSILVSGIGLIGMAGSGYLLYKEYRPEDPFPSTQPQPPARV